VLRRAVRFKFYGSGELKVKFLIALFLGFVATALTAGEGLASDDVQINMRVRVERQEEGRVGATLYMRNHSPYPVCLEQHNLRHVGLMPIQSANGVYKILQVEGDVTPIESIPLGSVLMLHPGVSTIQSSDITDRYDFSAAPAALYTYEVNISIYDCQSLLDLKFSSLEEFWNKMSEAEIKRVSARGEYEHQHD
jgi:hypothetical protein